MTGAAPAAMAAPGMEAVGFFVLLLLLGRGAFAVFCEADLKPEVDVFCFEAFALPLVGAGFTRPGWAPWAGPSSSASSPLVSAHSVMGIKAVSVVG